MDELAREFCDTHDAREVAYVVAFLVSPKSVAINGDAISVGGGYRGPIYY